MTEETRFIRRTALIAAAAFCVCAQTWAREITWLDVSADDATATVTMTAGEDGDSHVLYYAWSTDGADKGADISAWPHVLRTGRVADDATEATIELPAAAAVTAQYACRAFLATSAVDYDYLVEGTKGSATKNNVTFLNTGLKPVGGKYSVSVDCVLGKNTTQQYLFGSNGGNITFCAYVNGGGSWAFACNDGTGNWNMSTGLEANTTDRVSVFLDSTGSTATGMVTVASSGAQYIKTTTAAHTKTANTVLCLWGRGSNGTGTTIDKYCAATIYSCVITNDGVRVRDFRPAVKDGVAGMWDACDDKFYKSAGSTAFNAGTNTTYFVVDGDAVVAQSPSWTQATSDYVTDTPYVEPLSLTFASGGTKSGAAPLTLTGANNWGGLFTVYEGTLVADFGQGLAATDNLVLNGGTYCPVTAGTFTGSFGSGGGQISVVPLAEGGTGAGFSAYGHPLEVTLGGNSALPLAVGPSSDPLFDVPLLLNDAYATDALTFKNGIEGDGSTPTLTNVVDGATALVKGAVTGVKLVKTGAGTLALEGNNAFETLAVRDGRLVVATPEGAGSQSVSTIAGASAIASETVFSNAAVTANGGVTINSGGTLELCCGAVFASDDIRSGGSSAGTLLVDGSTLTSSGALRIGNNNGSGTAGTVVITNNANVSFGALALNRGTCRQYGGSVKFTGDVEFGPGYSPSCVYELHGGRFEASSTANNAFSLGNGSSSAYPKGYFRVYEGGEAIVRARYPMFGSLTGGSSGNTSNANGNYGYLQVYGGSFSVLRANNDAELRIGHYGFGIMTVTNNGLVYVEGGITASYSPGSTARTSTVGLYKDGIVRARWLRAKADPAVYTTTLVMDGATLIAQTNAAADFVSNFRNASVGVNGMTIDTAGQDVTIAQDFDARAEQPRPLDGIESASGDDLAAFPAFTKAGEGTLTLTGSNAWACATCVSNGTLAASGEFSLPETTTLQLAGGVLDLCGRTHTVSNLVGSGVVSNGALVVTGAVWPGHRGGVMEFRDATLSARKLSYAFGDDGKCGCLVMGGALGLDGVEITVDNADAKERPGVAIVHAASISGAPTSALVGSNALSVSANAVRVGLAGMWILMR